MPDLIGKYLFDELLSDFRRQAPTHRFWSGLIKDYYIPRIQLYFTKDRNKIREWEEQWITSPWINSTTPFDDPVEAALNLIEKTNK